MIKKIFRFLKHELIEMLPPTLYFLVVFHILVLARQLMAQEWGVTISSTTAATLGALIVGKAILVADALPILSWFGRKRLVYDIALRTVLYALIALVFQFLEELIPMAIREGSLLRAVDTVWAEVQWPRFWVSHLFVIVFLAFYNVIMGLKRSLGHDQFIDILLNPESDYHLRSEPNNAMDSGDNRE